MRKTVERMFNKNNPSYIFPDFLTEKTQPLHGDRIFKVFHNISNVPTFLRLNLMKNVA